MKISIMSESYLSTLRVMRPLREKNILANRARLLS